MAGAPPPERETPMRTTLTTLAAALALTTACGTNPDEGVPVDRATFEENGHTWPLTVDEGTIHQNNDAIYFEDADGNTYALNGIAQQDHDPLDPIWLQDEDMIQEIEEAGAEVDEDAIPRVSIGPLIDTVNDDNQ